MLPKLRLSFGASAGIARALDRSARYARTRDPIVILGERGTGKTALAQHIHALSGRTGAFIGESAPAIPKDMETAHLTGHARGAFTGAYQDRCGLLEGSHQGTFFLDEVGLASNQVQRVLLRLLESPSIRRLGETRERTVDVRLIVATNEELGALVSRGEFRADLFDRLGSMMIRLPPLQDRQDEILPLAARFLADAGEEMGLETAPSLAPEVQAFFLTARWLGNIRQLRSVCRAALAMAYPRTEVEMQDLPPEFVASLGDVGRARCTRAADNQERLREALAQANGSKTKAARLLGISRQTLYRLLNAATAGVLAAVCHMSANRLQTFMFHVTLHRLGHGH
jgi:two-component system response regulator HydG